MKKRKYIFAAALLAAVLVCSGCGSKSVQSTTAAQPAQTDASVTVSDTTMRTPEQTDAEAVSETEKPTAAEGKTAQSDPVADSTTTRAGSDKETTEKTAVKKEVTTFQSGTPVTTKAAAASTKPAGSDKSTTAKAPTEKESTTLKTDAPAGEKTPGSTEKTTSATKPTESSSSTKPTPAAKGNAIHAAVSFLNDAEEGYTAKLTEKQLESFGMTGDAAKKVLKNPKDWNAYTIRIDFENQEVMPVTLYYLNVTENGRNDIYINGEMMGEPGIPIHGKASQKFYVLAPTSISDGYVLQKLHDMKMEIQYAATPGDDNVMPSFVYAPVN